VFGDIESLFDNAHEMAMIFDEEAIVRFTQRFKDLPLDFDGVLAGIKEIVFDMQKLMEKAMGEQ
jgi:hypothetical protein